ncbi:hypothetical protein DRE_04341 [Drechslerella stenobrocha 248]|uniref:VHS domain-containing protein n=1 Tax=Drechslerella stenobrocha 248 TaxID=1043628 RepID=W7I264_9PEZI|nr:hypothetical protein DRE_04341 [Drechslerella stenobrocha 248]
MFASKKPFTAVSALIDRLTTEEYDENDLSGIPELIEAVRLQDTGPQEAARAIRKKLKYGNIHRQIRALTVWLDDTTFVENAGKRFQRSFADEPLLERLRILSSDSLTDPDVRKKAQILFAQWHSAYRETPGMTGVANLYRQVPTKPRPRPQPRPVSPTDDDAHSPPARSSLLGSGNPYAGPSHSRNNSNSKPQGPITLGPSDAPIATFKPPKEKSSKSSKSASSSQKRPPFNLEKEKPTMIQNIATASIASTNLKNALKLINREKERVSDNPEVMKRFEACKLLRRQILRYIQHVESEQWLGGLIHANEELVEALTLFEILDKPPGEDSDSEAEWEQMPKDSTDEAATRLGKLKIVGGGHSPMPPGQVPPRERDYDSSELEDASEDEEPEDPNDPFGDSHALKTPAAEKSEVRW